MRFYWGEKEEGESGGKLKSTVDDFKEIIIFLQNN
jgi:hypothetical protein